MVSKENIDGADRSNEVNISLVRLATYIDDLQIFPYVLCLFIFSSYIPVVLIMFPYCYNHHIIMTHHVSLSLVCLTIICWSCQFPRLTTSESWHALRSISATTGVHDNSKVLLLGKTCLETFDRLRLAHFTEFANT